METKKKTKFHEACDRFSSSIDGSRRMFSKLTDVFSQIAWQDFTNEWAPEWAETCFKFNKAQKKFQHDFREWADSITDDDIKAVQRLFGVQEPAVRSFQGGDDHRTHTQKAHIARRKATGRKMAARRKHKAQRRT